VTIDRDRSLDRLLRQSHSLAAAPVGACLDPDTVAAWLDGTLSPSERTAAEAHASGCARCQSVIAMTVKSEAATAPNPFSRAPFMRWLAPLALAEAALLIWMVVAPRSGSVEAPAAPTSDSPPAVAKFEQPAAPPVAAPQPVSPPPAAREQAAAPKLKKEKQQAEPASSSTLDLARRPEPDKTAQLDFRAKANEVARQDSTAMQAAPLVIPSPDPMVRWRVTPQGTVERSVDGGITWTLQDTGVGVTVHAGKSPARDVVWLVGSDGVVLISVDGQNWQRRSVGEPVALVDVNPADGLTATVTASDGRKFATRDGGVNWVHPPLQENPAAPF
jgi:hypothetical protein